MAVSATALRNRLKLRQLVLLAELEAEGSLHKASRKLGMSQPAATRLVHELEDLMGDSLFERTSRGMVPTDMGRLLMRHASMVLAGIEHVYQEAAELRSGNAGVLRLGMFPGAPPKLVADAVIGLKRAAPQMEIKLVQGNNDALLDELRGGKLDLVVGRAPAASMKAAYDFELLYNEHFSVVSGASMPAPTAPCGLEKLIDLPWILPLAGTTLRSNLDLLFFSQCGRLPYDFIEAVYSPLVLTLVVEGGRVATMPSWIAHEHHITGKVGVLIASLGNITGPVGMITRAGEPLSSQASRIGGALRRSSESLGRALSDPEIGSPLPIH